MVEFDLSKNYLSEPTFHIPLTEEEKKFIVPVPLPNSEPIKVN